MEWWDLSDSEIEGGVLEFASQLELYVFRRIDGSEPVAVWLNDDASYYRAVEVGEA